jgi:succinyl-CoA synthetase beta subunit
MNLHEYQAKQLFQQFGITVPDGRVADSTEAAMAAARSLGGAAWMVKAQVHAGGRGKAGGVKRVQSESELQQVVNSFLHSRLVTAQTGTAGQPINQVLI